MVQYASAKVGKTPWTVSTDLLIPGTASSWEYILVVGDQEKGETMDFYFTGSVQSGGNANVTFKTVYYDDADNEVSNKRVIEKPKSEYMARPLRISMVLLDDGTMIIKVVRRDINKKERFVLSKCPKCKNYDGTVSLQLGGDELRLDNFGCAGGNSGKKKGTSCRRSALFGQGGCK